MNRRFNLIEQIRILAP